MTGYLGAVGSAVGVSLALSHVIKRSDGMRPSMKLLLQRFVPFPAVCMLSMCEWRIGINNLYFVAFASCCNVALMRFSEIFSGIEVVDSHGTVVGTSTVAAKQVGLTWSDHLISLTGVRWRLKVIWLFTRRAALFLLCIACERTHVLTRIYLLSSIL